MIIRQERPEDYDTVYHVVKEAFENAEYTDGNEQNLVAALRKSKSFIPELSLVAVEDEKIVGHILFTKAVVQGVEVLALAPSNTAQRVPDHRSCPLHSGLAPDRESHNSSFLPDRHSFFPPPGKQTKLIIQRVLQCLPLINTFSSYA